MSKPKKHNGDDFSDISTDHLIEAVRVFREELSKRGVSDALSLRPKEIVIRQIDLDQLEPDARYQGRLVIDLVNRIDQQAYDVGARDAIATIEPTEQALHKCALWSLMIVTTTSCDPGSATTKTMKDALANFAKSMQELETTMNEDYTDGRLIADWSDVQPALDYWIDMRKKVAAYLKKISYAGLVQLRDFLQENDVVVKNLDLQIAEHKKRGRKLDAAYRLIGEWAELVVTQRKQKLQTPLENWEIGHEVYEALNAIAIRNGIQQIAFDNLSIYEPVHYIEPDGTKGDHRRAYGQYIYRARAAYHKSILPSK